MTEGVHAKEGDVLVGRLRDPIGMYRDEVYLRDLEPRFREVIETHLRKKKPPTVMSIIRDKMRQGVPLEGVFNPKTNLTRWELGGQRVHGRPVMALIDYGFVEVMAGEWPFTNRRVGRLTERGRSVDAVRS